MPIILHKATCYNLPTAQAKMTERLSKDEPSFQKAYGLIRRSGLRPLLCEVATEEKPWKEIVKVHLQTTEGEACGVIQVVGQVTLEEDEEGNYSGIAIIYSFTANGETVTILSFDKPQVICGKKNGILKKEVFEASQNAVGNPGIFIFNQKQQTLTLMYRNKQRKVSIDTMELPVN